MAQQRTHAPARSPLQTATNGKFEAEPDGEGEGFYQPYRYDHDLSHSFSHPFLRILYRCRWYLLLAFVVLFCSLAWCWLAVSVGVTLAERMSRSLSATRNIDGTMMGTLTVSADATAAAAAGSGSGSVRVSTALTPSSRGQLLACNRHHGVRNEMRSFLSFVPNHVQHMSVREPEVYEVTYELAEKQWNKERWEADCRAYEYIMLGDTIPKGRPYLQHVDECTAAGAKIIVLVTNRYDWSVVDDKQYHAIVAHASRNPHVRVVQNNPYEEYYANVLKSSFGPNIRFYDYIASSGKPDDVHGMYEEEKQKRIGDDSVDQMFHPSHIGKEDVDVWLHEHPHELSHAAIVDAWYGEKDKKRGQPSLAAKYGSLHDQSIFMLPKPYGGPLSLSHRIILFVPYQVNTMAMWENMGYNVTYILPSARLFQQWRASLQIPWNNVHVPDKLPMDAYENYIDWWRKDLQQFFYYFDDLRELVRDSPLRRRIKAERKEHIEKQWRYMSEVHYPMVKQKWIKLFDELK